MTPDQTDPSAGNAPGKLKNGFPWIAAGLTACLAFCCAILFRLAMQSGRELNFFKVDAAQSIPIQTPPWVPAEWVEEARARAAARECFSIFDDITIKELCADLKKLPWVKDVRELERGLPRTLRLSITPRAPVAVVETRDAILLVDADGVVLPPATFAADSIAALPRIVKWKGSFAQADTGGRWDDEGVQDGVSVAVLLPQLYFTKLARVAPEFRVAKIDVANAGGEIDKREPEVFLTTSTGVRIKWGRAPRNEKYGEVPVDVKFNNLAIILKEYAGLNGVAVINLRYDEPDIFDAQGQWIPRPALVSQAGR
ncbi:MAG: hypothetical protein HY286_18615 [Planctomycetes bacterium]|nr:hypothetical protein [Planctomycetota bacterium]